MPPMGDPLSRNFLDEPFALMLADKKERQALSTHTGPETCYGPSSNIPFCGRGSCRLQASRIRMGSL